MRSKVSISRKLLLSALLMFGLASFLHAYTLNENKEACEFGDMAGCYNLGVIYKNRHSYELSKKYFLQSCRGGFAKGCNRLGVLLREGSVMKRDIFEAVKLFRTASDFDDAQGHFHLGEMYRDGEGVRQSSLKARELFGKACDGGCAEGCREYAIINKKIPVAVPAISEISPKEHENGK